MIPRGTGLEFGPWSQGPARMSRNQGFLMQLLPFRIEQRRSLHSLRPTCFLLLGGDPEPVVVCALLPFLPRGWNGVQVRRST